MENLEKIYSLLQSFIEVFGPELFYVGAAFFLLHCLFGYQLLRVWATIIGMALGGAVGFYYGLQAEWSVPLMIAVTVVAAAALGWVFYQIYLLGVFALFAGGTYLFMHFLFPDASMFAVIASMIGIGVVGVLCVRPLTIFFTAVLGGFLASLLFLAARGNYDTKTLLIMTAVAAGVGIIVQFFLTAPLRDKAEEEEAPEEEAPLPVITMPAVEPIENLQPAKIEHAEGLPSSDELDRMIEEQLQETRFEGITEQSEAEAPPADTEESAAAEEPFAEAAELDDKQLDELIAEESPDVEEYLYKEAADAVADTVFDPNAQNDFSAAAEAAVAGLVLNEEEAAEESVAAETEQNAEDVSAQRETDAEPEAESAEPLAAAEPKLAAPVPAPEAEAETETEAEESSPAEAAEAETATEAAYGAEAPYERIRPVFTALDDLSSYEPMSMAARAAEPETDKEQSALEETLPTEEEIESDIAALEQKLQQEEYNKQIKETARRISASLEDIQKRLLHNDDSDGPGEEE